MKEKIATFFLLFVLVSFLTHCSNLGEVNKPNILFIIADDQSWEAMGHMNGEVKTPHLDRLAKEGVSFRHAYNMGSWSGAVCVASRHMFNMGRSVWHSHSLIKQNKNEKTPKAKAWSEHLRDVGYTTYFAGKWHVKYYEPRQIFDHVGTVRPGMPKQTELGYNRPLDQQDKRWLPWDQSHGGFWKGGTHWSEVLREEALGFIHEAKEKPDPFFMYISFNAPHDPRQAPKEFVDMYPAENVKVPESFQARYPYDKQIGCDEKLRDARLAPFPRTAYSVQVNRQEYYAIITHMDQQIGQILDSLEKSGKLNNTYVVFTADHGLAVGHHGLIGKQNMYEHSLGAPLIIRGPGIKPGGFIKERVYIQDIVPTTLELAGSKKNTSKTDFKSLLKLVKGKKTKGREIIYGAYKNLQRCVIFEDWKLIYYPNASTYRLYDLKNDPNEINDLAVNPEYANRLRQMKVELAKEMKKLNDPL